MKNDIRTAMEHAREELLALLSLYEETDGLQGAFQGGDAWDYALNELDRIRGQMHQMLRDPAEETPLWQVLLCASDVYRILDETEFFIRQCEVPGVVTRWKRINPRLIYFDCAFTLMESCPDTYRDIQRGLTGLSLSCYPDPELVAERNAYFKEAEKDFDRQGRDFSEEFLFQEELKRTVRLLFEEAAQAVPACD